MFKISTTGMNISMQAIDQLHFQSVIAPSDATHAADAVATYRCHELWSHTHVAKDSRDNNKLLTCRGHYSFLFQDI